jgi:hypothetical protein
MGMAPGTRFGGFGIAAGGFVHGGLIHGIHGVAVRLETGC